MVKDKREDCCTCNWNDVWKVQMEMHNSMEGSTDCVRYWNNNKLARDYSNMIENFKSKDMLLEKISNIENIENLKILDIGAGPGTHTLPLSKIAKEVTAVEPAKAMLSCLKYNLEKHKINNVVCINETWENIKLGKHILNKYDIVIASFSLGMTDIKSALKKMNEVSSRYVFLVWNSGIPGWEKICIEIWKALHKIDYCPMPRTDCLIGVLNQIGIYPKVSTYNEEGCIEFLNINEAFEHYKLDFQITTKFQENILKDYLKNNTIKKDGKLLLNDDENYAIISWETKK